MAPNWLKDAVFYQIYPQSFYDSNGDGIGDIPGMIQKLPYVKSLGCNAIWMNPCFDSPFKDAGYDVRDYKKVAPRYGTNEDLVRLFQEAHKLGLKVLLDLVPGHTSEEHAWFKESCAEERNDLWERYIWTDGAFCGGDGMPFIGGEAPRDGTYIINFFKCQPALNYGYRDRRQPWQQAITDPGPMATRKAMKEIMAYWLDRGCDGFRVDMADSLVKNDGCEKLATMEVWKDMAGFVHENYPDAALVSEWNNPMQALGSGFDMDLYLNWDGNGYASLMRNYRVDENIVILEDNSFFKADSKQDMKRVLEDYVPAYHKTKDLGLYCWFTCNHDTKRPSYGKTDRELRLFYAFIFTMPGAPFLYYGDELGMRYLPLKTKEGGFQRTGSRTPMQWDGGKNHGFSASDTPYLPVDESVDAPTVENQERDPASMLNFVRGLIRLRKEYEDLGNYSPFAVYKSRGKLFAYKRGQLLIALNAGREKTRLKLDKEYKLLYTVGQVSLKKELTLEGGSFAVLG